MEATTATRYAAFGSHIRVILTVVGRLRHVAWWVNRQSRRGWAGSARSVTGVPPPFRRPRRQQEEGCVRIFETAKSRRGTTDARNHIEHNSAPTYSEVTQWVRPVGPPVNTRSVSDDRFLPTDRSEAAEAYDSARY